jgi:serine/threonine protein kinase/Tfp pilus assembly protein PilF
MEHSPQGAEELDNSKTPTASIDPQTGRPGSIPPEKIGRYMIVRPLGRGGMGEVFEAEQTEPVHRKVALKLIKGGMDSQEVLARFDSERQALAIMNHPNIARMLDGGVTEQGVPYFVMDYIDGMPITEYCDSHSLSNSERLDLFTQVCAGVQHAHQKGIIHRDIKPSNVLVTVEDQRVVPKIIDFGLAKALGSGDADMTQFTHVGQVIGTPDYMSPEQVSGADIDTRTDVYSLGVLLYQLLVGIVPFGLKETHQGGWNAFQKRVCEQEPVRPSVRVSSWGKDSEETAKKRRVDQASWIRELHGDLDWITLKALEKDRARRYQSVSELAADITRHLNNEPVLARPHSTAYNIRKFIRRHRIGVAAASIAGLAILIGIAGVTIGLLRSVRSEKRATEEAVTAKQVSDFMVDLFKVSDPSQTKGNTITAREILDRGAKKIEQQLSGQPPIKARLMETMGKVYSSLGLYTQARVMLEKTLQLKRKIHGSDHLSVAETLHYLGIVYEQQGKYDEAASQFKKSLDIRSKQLKPDDPQIARSLNSLAIVLYDQGKYAEAEPLLERSLAIKEKTARPDNAEIANTLINLGIIKHSQKKYADAEAFFKRALAVSEGNLGAENPDLVATILNSLGSLYDNQGRRSEAEPLYLRSLAIWEKMLGPDHPDVAIALHNLANLYRNIGKYAQAEPLYLRSLAIWEKTFGPDHPYVGIGLRERANSYRDQGKHADADPLYLRSLQIFEKKLDENHANMIMALENYILLLRKMNRTEEALKVENRLNGIQRKK